MKMEVHHPKFFAIFRKYDGFKKGELKLKVPNQLQEVLDIARDLLYELRNPHCGDDHREGIEEHESKLEMMKMVLEMHRHFNGINRKIQLKYQPYGRSTKSSESDAEKEHRPSLLLILKWGGELTPAGRKQAEELGKAFRCLVCSYPFFSTYLRIVSFRG
jgi:inositol hexakisphosphate/diphosphoinositol-pentakisphosphate kinase